MGTSVNKKIAFYSVITVIVIVLGIIFPVYHLYDPLFGHNPTISVKDGFYNVTYSGNYRNISSTNPVLFSTGLSRSTVVDNNYPNSTLDLQLMNGGIFYLGGPSSDVNIVFNLTVGGHFTGNLHPKSLTLSFGAVGPNQTSITLETSAPPHSTWVPEARNLSPDTFGNLVLVGPGNVSVTTNLLNQSSNVPFYNFYVSVQMWLTVKWYSGSTHTFNLSAQVNGLGKPVNSTLSMTIVEVN